MTLSVRLGPDPIFDDPVNTLKRDNARSSSVGGVGSMLTSFDGDNARSSSVGGVGSMLTSFDGKLECIFGYNYRPFAKISL
nr:hypothetical protein [Tanacetum cinerariifolium]